MDNRSYDSRTVSLDAPEAFTDAELQSLPVDVSKRIRGYNNYMQVLQERLQAVQGEFNEHEQRVKLQQHEWQKRERNLIRRLTAKEQEMQDAAIQISELKSNQSSTRHSATLLDPAVCVVLQKLRDELAATQQRLDDTQNELSAWKFTPDSNTGKRLMAKCRLLYTENEELGKLTSNGRIAKLESELALQKSFSEEVKKSQSELDEFLQDLDEDVEGMQSTIYYLQQKLVKSNETISNLESELEALRAQQTQQQQLTHHEHNNATIVVESSAIKPATNCQLTTIKSECYYNNYDNDVSDNKIASEESKSDVAIKNDVIAQSQHQQSHAHCDNELIRDNGTQIKIEDVSDANVAEAQTTTTPIADTNTLSACAIEQQQTVNTISSSGSCYYNNKHATLKSRILAKTSDATSVSDLKDASVNNLCNNNLKRTYDDTSDLVTTSDCGATVKQKRLTNGEVHTQC